MKICSKMYKNSGDGPDVILYFDLDFNGSLSIFYSDFHYAQRAGYMLVNPIPQSIWSTQYPGRHILLDIGTGMYESGSLPWFTDVYSQRGVNFAEIFGGTDSPAPCLCPRIYDHAPSFL